MRHHFLRLMMLFMVAIPSFSALADEPEAHYATLDGVRVRYRDYGQGDEVVVLIHGLTMDMTAWRNQIPALAKTYRVLALDLPGHGGSGFAAGAYTPTLFARAVSAVMDDARARRATLVGHSLGLPIILAFLNRYPERVKGVVSVDGAIVPTDDPKAKAAFDTRVAAITQRLSGPDAKTAMRDFMTPMLTKAAPALKKEVLAGAESADRAMLASVFRSLDEPAVWQPVVHTLPMLAVYTKDSEAGVKEWLAARFPAAKLEVWGDVDHFLHLEKPDRLTAKLQDFLAQTAAPVRR